MQRPAVSSTHCAVDLSSPMEIKFTLSKIFILESLFDNDLKTGKELFSDVIRWKIHNEKRLEVEHLEISNLKDFGEAMSKITSQSNTGVSPLIHFEMHGSKNKDGLILKSRELIDWNYLSNLTREINIASRNNLTISLATCYGAYFLTSIEINKACPFSCCLSTTDISTSEEISKGFSAFFDTLLTNYNINISVSELNKSANNKFHFFSAEEFLQTLLRKVISEDFNKNSMVYRNWVNSIVKKYKSIALENSLDRKKDLKKIIRAQLQRQGSSLERELRQDFLAYYD